MASPSGIRAPVSGRGSWFGFSVLRTVGVPVQGSPELDTSVLVSCSVRECSVVGDVCAGIGQSRQFVLKRSVGQHLGG